MNIANILIRAGTVFEQQPAVALGETIILNYRELANNSAVLAQSLLDNFNLKPGDRVGIIAENCPEYIEIYFAVWHAGLVVVPINAKLHKKEFSYILNHSGCRVCFTSNPLFPTINKLIDDLYGLKHVIEINSHHYNQLLHGDKAIIYLRNDDDPAWLFYTSGTTGKPKGAMQSHKNLFSMIQCYFSDVDSIETGDSIFHAAPMSHGGGYYILPHIVNGGVNVVPRSGRFDEQELLDLIKVHKNVSMFAAPTMLKRLMEYSVNKSDAFKNLKTIIYGGGPMYLSDLENAQHLLGNKLVQIYGQGECPMSICALTKYQHNDTNHLDYKERLASIGMPMIGMKVKISDPYGNRVEDGQVGEVLVNGNAVMLGYYNDQKATAETINDGWLKTGDMAIQNKNGFISLVDRAKDMIISGGANIYPREVEEVLNQYRNVSEASVIGQKDDKWGEIVVAIVVPSSGQKLDTRLLDKHCIKHIARYKRPKKYIVVKSLPKNNTGKTLKTELRKQYG